MKRLIIYLIVFMLLPIFVVSQDTNDGLAVTQAKINIQELYRNIT